jgi:hypothetical protein
MLITFFTESLYLVTFSRSEWRNIAKLEPTGTLFLSERAEKICVSNEHKDIGETRTECAEQLPVRLPITFASLRFVMAYL